MLKLLKAIKKQGLPMNEVMTLAWIHKNPGTRQSAWAKEFGMGPTVCSPVARSLVNKGLVIEEQRTDPDCNNVNFKAYHLSPKGQSLMTILNAADSK